MSVEILTKDDLESTLDERFHRFESKLKEEIQFYKRWLRTKEAAEYLSISESQLHNYKAQGLISCQKLGGINYYDREKIDKRFEEKFSQ